MNAKEYLEEVRHREEFLRCKKAELYRLKDLETNITSQLKEDVVQSNGNKDKVGLLVSKRIDFENEVIKAAEQDFLSCRNECIELLEQVKQVSFQQYKVLHRRYIEYMSLKAIAKKEAYAQQYIRALHAKGLETFEKILENSKYNTK